MFDMAKMMSKVKDMEAQIKKTKANLETVEATGESGGNMVTVTVSGNKKIIAIDIDSSIIKSEDKILLQDLILAATNNALKEIDEQIKQEIQKDTEGLLPNMFGMNLSNLFK